MRHTELMKNPLYSREVTRKALLVSSSCTVFMKKSSLCDLKSVEFFPLVLVLMRDNAGTISMIIKTPITGAVC